MADVPTLKPDAYLLRQHTAKGGTRIMCGEVFMGAETADAAAKRLTNRWRTVTAVPAFTALAPQSKIEPTDDLRMALAPFIHAAAVGWLVEKDVADAKPRQSTDRPLIAFASYAGQYAAQSRVSWADWRRLLDACDDAGLLNKEGEGNGPAA